MMDLPISRIFTVSKKNIYQLDVVIYDYMYIHIDLFMMMSVFVYNSVYIDK